MKKYILLFLVLLSFKGFAQNTINNYKYVIVPEKFSFLKQNDQYKLNTLTKALLQDKGFTVYFDNADLPDEIANNKCNALVVDLLEKNSMFSTNLTMLLKDCRGKVIFETKQGKSREKEYTVSYNLALRDAFTSLTETPYAYQPLAETSAQQANTTAAVAAGTQVTASAGVAVNVPAGTATASVPAKAPATAASVPVVSVVAAPVSANTATTATANIAGSTVTAAAGGTPAGKAITAKGKLSSGTLYAQPTATGYQLIDTAPKIILTLYKSSVENYFIANNGSSNGIVFKKNDSWVYEYYNNGQLMTEKLLIKF